jgi:hypothetical protein
MSIPKSTMDVIDEMANVPADMQVYVAETARDAWDGYLELLAEEAEENFDV